MRRQELENFLKTQTPNATLLYGDGVFWIQHYASQIAKQTTQPENISKFYFGEYDYALVLSLLGQSSLFGDRTLVILKIDKKISKKELQALVKATQSNTDNFLLIEFYHNEARTSGEYSKDCKEMASAFNGAGAIEVRFFKPSLQESQLILAQKAKEHQLQISGQTLTYLLNLQNGDLGIALKELEKFSHYNHQITHKDIDALCSSLGNLEFDDLLKALLEKKQVLPIYAQLEEEGLDEMELLNAIASYFYRLFVIFAHMRISGNIDLKEILGYIPPRHIAERYTREASSLREWQYQHIFEALLDWRLAIFAGKGKALNAIIALNKLQEILR
ncbi:hypothetical protein BBW65_05065 [Helicobacter enhydrae]|uniref:DNA polymerase III delta N-terminal domain-containing protein n=1 Tax=Helicobacter enhydrae TaxID=222136 RepID=A0A1B1U5Y8_9HELI|nr:DNA polymerase III subunit delta [Helicobacter enhydrae]ANV98207.1 hypothetical protein BBW65_05065 [Helicobacter enhydrae]